jgi:hypothetical protein
VRKFTKDARNKIYGDFITTVSGRTSDLSSSVISGSVAEMNGLFGTADEFMGRYKDAQNFYMALLSDEKNLSKKAGTSRAVENARVSGRMDLDVLNYESKKRVQDLFGNEVLRLPQTMHKYGMPGLDLPSSNPYRFLTQFDVNTSGQVHPALMVLNSMYFNIDPNASLSDGINKGISNMMSYTEMQSAMNQIGPRGQLSPYGKAPSVGSTKKILMLDTETTGVDTNARVRSYAAREAIMDSSGEVTMADSSTARKLFFRQPGMEGGLIQTPTGLKSLSVGATEIEGGLDLMIDVTKDPKAAQAALHAEFEHMMTFDTIAAKNAKFDMRMLVKTAMEMPGYGEDESFRNIVTEFTERVYNDPNFVTDIDVSTRLHFQRKFDEYATTFIGAATSDATSEQAIQLQKMGISIPDVTTADASQIKEFEADARNFLYSRRIAARNLLESAELGGSFTPRAMNNIGLNSNLFELIYREAAESGTDARAAKDLMNMMARGSHVAETDVPLAHFVGKYIQTGQLDFSPENLNHLPAGVNRVKTQDFIDFAKASISKSSAPTMTTNIADVSHLSRKATNLLRTNEGRKLFSVEARIEDIMTPSEMTALTSTGEDLTGLTGTVKFDEESGRFRFRTSDERLVASGLSDETGFVRTVDIANQSSVNRYMDRTLQDAISGTASRRLDFGIAGVQSVIQNDAAQKISFNINYGQLGEIQRYNRSITSALDSFDADVFKANLGSMDERSLVQALTATARLTSSDEDLSTSIIDSTLSRKRVDPAFGTLIRDSLESGSLEPYARMATEIGNPYADTDITARAMGVRLSEITAGKAKQMADALPSGSGMSFMKNADVLTEFGFSYFGGQDVTRIVEGDELVKSKLLISQDVFDLMKVRVEGETEAVRLADAITSPTMKIVDDADNVVASAAEFNRIRVSGVAGTQNVVNAFIGGQGAYTRSQSRILAESLYSAANEVLSATDLGDETIGEAEGVAKRNLQQMRNLRAYTSGRTAEEAIDELTEKIHTGGLGFASLKGEAGEAFSASLEQAGLMTENNDLLSANKTARLIQSQDGSVILSQFEDYKASAMKRGTSSAQEAARSVEADKKAVDLASVISDHLDDNRGIRDQVLSERTSLKVGKKFADETAAARAMYAKYKKPAGLAGLGVAAAGIGYYAYKRSQESSTYDDVMDPMETMPAMAPRTDLYREDFMSGQNFSVTGDPLATAGVVGNLDRNKIGHTNMGPNKYDYLYAR